MIIGLGSSLGRLFDGRRDIMFCSKIGEEANKETFGILKYEKICHLYHMYWRV